MRRIEEQDGNGNVLRTTEYDIDAGTVTVTDGAGTAVTNIPPAELESLRAADREQKQLDRLQGKFDQLKASTLPDSTRLTVADYRQNLGPADLRAMATLVNDLRADVIDLRSMVLDLTRLVRGMAAE